MGWFLLAELCIEGAEAEVAVGLERAHAEFVGQGEGLAVEAGGGLGRWTARGIMSCLWSTGTPRERDV
jgi:hypothetical protein